MKKEKCISCGKETQYDEFEHIDHRYFYIEGVGQLCCACYNDAYYAPRIEHLLYGPDNF